MSKIDLHTFRRNEHSQFGEDGILERLFAELGITSGTFCEFGAWDGQHLSNTRLLFDRGWRGIYIEGDPARHRDLVRNVSGDRAELVCAYVQPTGKDSLDDLLGQSRIVGPTKTLDFLSIDIDSDDLAVWRGLTHVRPRVVIIEFNPTIPLDVEFENPHGENKGNSAAAIHRFAAGAGYDLVATTHCNLIYVDATHRPETIAARSLRIEDLSGQTRFFWGYDGTLIVGRTADEQGGPRFSSPEVVTIPWKSAFFAQPTPRMFRHYDQSPLKNRLLRASGFLSTTLTRPVSALRLAAGLLRGRRPR